MGRAARLSTRRADRLLEAAILAGGWITALILPGVIALLVWQSLPLLDGPSLTCELSGLPVLAAENLNEPTISSGAIGIDDTLRRALAPVVHDPQMLSVVVTDPPSGKVVVATQQGEILLMQTDSARCMNHLVLLARWSFGNHPISFLHLVPQRDLVVAGSHDGHLALFHPLHREFLASCRCPNDLPPEIRVLTLDAQRRLLVHDNGFSLRVTWKAPHPELSWATLFGRIPSDNKDVSVQNWRPPDSAGTGFIPNMGILLTDTLLVVLLALAFALPLAGFAAVGASELAPRRLLNSVRLVLHVFAAIPTVAVGILVAFEIAPRQGQILPAVFIAAASAPAWIALTAVLRARARVLMPRIRTEWMQFALVAVGMTVSALILAESHDLVSWTDWTQGRTGSSAGLWAGLMAPPLLVLGFLGVRSRGPGAVLVAMILITLLAMVLGQVAADIHDPRPWLLGHVAERNLLLAAVVAGIALVPVFASLALESLRAVPARLRETAIACGATRWQSFRRVVLPLARRGLVAAMLVTASRAVSETIAVMLVGGTSHAGSGLLEPVQTLQVTAVLELPHADPASTHFRLLVAGSLGLLLLGTLLHGAATLLIGRRGPRDVTGVAS